MECIKKLHDTVETLDTLGRNCLNCIKCLMQICTASIVRHIMPLPTLFLASVFYSDISSVDRIVSDSLMIPWWFVSGYATHYLPIAYPLPTHCLPQQSLTSRQKHFHYPDGRIFGCGPKEVYQQQQRDFKRNPRTPAEEAQHQRWTAACREAARITKDPNHPRYAEMVSRHASQLDGQPDPVLGKKRICQFSNFIRAVLIHES